MLDEEKIRDGEKGRRRGGVGMWKRTWGIQGNLFRCVGKGEPESRQ